LQAITLCQQGDVLRRQVFYDGVETFPKFLAAHACVGQHFGLYEFVQVGGNLQAVHSGAFGGVLAHGEVSLDKSKTGKQGESYWIALG
jgi:hypothetical protein